MTKIKILATLALLTGLHFTSPQPALASINIHAFGPDNVAQNIKASQCKLAFDGENHFKSSQNFYSLHIYSHDGTCLRFKRLETQCRPSIYHCKTAGNKAYAQPVAIFEKCSHPTFKGKVFKLKQTAEQACADKKSAMPTNY